MINRALIVGYGSIGKRHERILLDFGIEVNVVSKHTPPRKNVFSALENAIEIVTPDYIIIANETNKHADTLKQICSKFPTKLILVEKPLAMQTENLCSLKSQSNFRVGYNLRFHPALIELKKLLRDDKVISAHAYVGKHLSMWRPHIDYMHTYSAKKASGGGVLRDLSHELDYLQWLFGDWSNIVSLGGKKSELQIDSDDCWSIIGQSKKGTMISLQLNYLDRINRRDLTVIGNTHTYCLDFISNCLKVDDKSEEFYVATDTTYIEQHKAMLSGNIERVASFDEAIHIMNVIESIEKSNLNKSWTSAS